jgi:hypothetical protein
MLIGVASLALASVVRAEDVTVQGEVVDPALYLREGRHGLDVEEQMYDAVDGGQSLGVLEDQTNTVYLCLASEPGYDPNELLYEHIGRRVSVTGDLYQRGGIKGLVVKTVQSLEPVPAPAEAASEIEP